jgi:hypothetical protein
MAAKFFLLLQRSFYFYFSSEVFIFIFAAMALYGLHTFYIIDTVKENIDIKAKKKN